MKLDKAKITLLVQREIHELLVFAISSRGPRNWNLLTNNPTDTIDLYPLFKSTIKENLLKLKTDTNYFNRSIF